jgi:hypothetical protein
MRLWNEFLTPIKTKQNKTNCLITWHLLALLAKNQSQKPYMTKKTNTTAKNNHRLMPHTKKTQQTKPRQTKPKTKQASVLLEY